MLGLISKYHLWIGNEKIKDVIDSLGEDVPLPESYQGTKDALYSTEFTRQGTGWTPEARSVYNQLVELVVNDRKRLTVTSEYGEESPGPRTLLEERIME